MATRKRKCCVVHCDDQTYIRHRLPIQNERLFDIWLDKIGNTKLMNMDRKEVYRSYQICEKHFREEYIVPGGRSGTTLTKTAIPTLHLKENPVNLTFNNQKPILSNDPVPSSFSSVLDMEIQNMRKSSIDIGSVLLHGNLDDQSVRVSETDNGFRSVTPTSCNLNQGNTTACNSYTLLGPVNITRSRDLSPKASYFYKLASQLKRRSLLLQKRCTTYKSRLEQATRYAETHQFSNILQKVNTTTYNFILSQIRTQQVKPRGRRFTFHDKTLALSLYKQSPKGYRLLAKIFSLPSKKTLNTLLDKVLFKPGINSHILQNLKISVSKLKHEEKLCLLIFDEISLAPGLTYDRKHDIITGLFDFGPAQRQSILADHAIVFMLKGIYRQWKQPIAFMFCKGTTETNKLINTLLEVISAIQETGLKIIGTVCDQGTTNVSAIYKLLSLSNTEDTCSFDVNEQSLITFFDPPHLMKGIRNNLLTKNLYFEMNGVKKVACWDHIVQFYKVDEGDDDTRMCPKLTDAHVIPDKIKKMKVSCCTQVFSRTVSALMRKLSQWSVNSKPLIDPRCSDTADLLLFMDKLFDSVNGHTLYAPPGKPLKCAITTTSLHINFWYEAIKVIKSMKFMCPRRGMITVPTVKHWIHTLKSFIHFTQTYVSQNESKYIFPRAFNQDVIENFFGCIRSHGVRNVNPTCFAFVTSYKTLILNNFLSHHSLHQNCEEDSTEGALNSLAAFITNTEEHPTTTVSNNAEYQLPLNMLTIRKSRVSKCTRVYIAGYIAKQLYIKTRNCATCRCLLLHGQSISDSDFIDSREYSAQLLCRPNTFLTFLVTRAISVITCTLNQICHYENISKVLVSVLKTNVDLNPLKCQEHPYIISLFCDIICKLMMFMWCKLVNRIIIGNDTRYIEFARQNKNLPCTNIKQQAFNLYKKSKRFRK